MILYLRIVVASLALITSLGCGNQDTTDKQNDVPADVLPNEVTDLYESLVKLRADLKLGITDDEYFEHLKNIQFRLDLTEGIQSESDGTIEILASAYRNYSEAYDCVQQINRPEDLPEYEPVRGLELQAEQLDIDIALREQLNNNARATTGVSIENLTKLQELQIERVLRGVEMRGTFRQIERILEKRLDELEARKDSLWERSDRLLSEFGSNN